MGLPLGQADPLGRQPGEALCPIRFPRDVLLERKSRVSSLVWNAEYQGSPTPAEGFRIKRAWLEFYVEKGPHRARRIRYWDKAGSEGEGAYTAGVRAALTEDGYFYIEDVKRGQWSAAEREKMIKQTAIADAQEFGSTSAVPQWVEQEPGSGGKESAENTMKMLLGFSAFKDSPTTNKDARLEPFAAAAENGFVRMVRAAWNMGYLDEMAAVPFSSLRDQADATAGAFNKLTKGGFMVEQADLQKNLSSKGKNTRRKAKPHE
jgi:predicted phage terminase large subunit-like protein